MGVGRSGREGEAEVADSQRGGGEGGDWTNGKSQGLMEVCVERLKRESARDGQGFGFLCIEEGRWSREFQGGRGRGELGNRAVGRKSGQGERRFGENGKMWGRGSRGFLAGGKCGRRLGIGKGSRGGGIATGQRWWERQGEG